MYRSLARVIHGVASNRIGIPQNMPSELLGRVPHTLAIPDENTNHLSSPLSAKMKGVVPVQQNQVEMISTVKSGWDWVRPVGY
jgi:hypothetical protein